LIFSIVIAVVAALAGGIASITGFGIGSLLTALVASHYGMKTAVGAVAIPHLIATVLRFWRMKSHVDRRVFFGFGLMNAAGSLAGALIHVWVDNPILTVVLGILLVFAGLIGVLGCTDRMRLGRGPDGSREFFRKRSVDWWATREEFGRLRCWDWEFRARDLWQPQQRSGWR